jgi:hypothetical protein
MTSRRLLGAAIIALSGFGLSCQGSGDDASGDGADSGASPGTASSGRRTGADRNACDLLTIEEVSAAAGEPVTAKEIHREEGRSDCQWEAKDGLMRMALVGYWTGGKEGWDILAGSFGAAKGILQKEEGVAVDSIVKSGPVVGLGDKAFFSDLFPSLVLKDNVLLEFTMPLIPNLEAKFRPLATKALSRL